MTPEDVGSVTPMSGVVRPSGEKSSLSQEVYARLKDSIFDFRMPPGRRYSEQELAAALEVSRTPLRLALHVLAHEGYLQNVGGHSAWQVRPLDLDFYEDLYDFRVEIESLALRRICAKETPADLSELRAFWCVPKKVRVLDGKIVGPKDEEFHRALVSFAGNQAMTQSFEELTDRIRIIRRLDFISPERIAIAYDEHCQILGALETRDLARAERLIRHHIETSRIEIRKLTLHHMAVATAATSPVGAAARSRR